MAWASLFRTASKTGRPRPPRATGSSPVRRHGLEPFGLLTTARKTVAVSVAAPKGPASSFPTGQRGAAPFALARAQAGSTTVEFGLVMVPLFAFLFLLFSTAWVIFARSTLQNAVREGVRFGVTGQTLGTSCLGSSIQQVVYQYSFGFIPASKVATEVQVTYYNPSTLAVITGSGSTAGGNVLQVSVSGLSVASFAPVWHTSSPINLSASASDVLESPPNGILPCP